MLHKAITFHQPYASLIGIKKFETRSRWYYKHRGEIAIHAGVARMPRENQWLYERVTGKSVADLPLGAVVSLAELTDVLVMQSCPQLARDYLEEGQHSMILRPEGERPFIIIETVPKLEQSLGFWAQGRMALKIDNVRPLETPIPATGFQGLWDWNHD